MGLGVELRAPVVRAHEPHPAERPRSQLWGTLLGALWLMKLELAECGQGPLVSRQVCRPSGGSLKVELSVVWSRNWLTFEGLSLSEDSLSLDLDFCSVTMHCGLSLVVVFFFLKYTSGWPNYKSLPFHLLTGTETGHSLGKHRWI